MENCPGVCSNVLWKARTDDRDSQERSVLKVITGLGVLSTEWEPALSQVVYGYRHRALHGVCSPFQLLYGVLPKMTSSDRAPLFPAADLSHREMELTYMKALRASRVEGQRELPATTEGKIIHFKVGDEVLVAIRRSIGALTKWPHSCRASTARVRFCARETPATDWFRSTMAVPGSMLTQGGFYCTRGSCFN